MLCATDIISLLLICINFPPKHTQIFIWVFPPLCSIQEWRKDDHHHHLWGQSLITSHKSSFSNSMVSQPFRINFRLRLWMVGQKFSLSHWKKQLTSNYLCNFQQSWHPVLQTLGVPTLKLKERQDENALTCAPRPDSPTQEHHRYQPWPRGCTLLGISNLIAMTHSANGCCSSFWGPAPTETIFGFLL